MKGTAWLRVVIVFLVLIGFAAALLQWAVSSPDDLKGLALNLGTEMLGAAVTYALLELWIGRRERREAEEEELEAKKAALIAQMGSKVHDVAIAAAEELQRHGWLYDGSLQGANLRGANLQEAVLSKANLQDAILFGANLQHAILNDANLQGTDLVYAKLQGANLFGANLQGAYLSQADLERAALSMANLQGARLRGANLQGVLVPGGATLPDGTRWTPRTDMTRFTDPDHPDFWSPDT